jgi:hypothetical protein
MMGRAFIAAGVVIMLLLPTILAVEILFNRGGDVCGENQPISGTDFRARQTSDGANGITISALRRLYYAQSGFPTDSFRATSGPFIDASDVRPQNLRLTVKRWLYSADSGFQKLSSTGRTLDTRVSRTRDVKPPPFPDKPTILLLTAGLIGFLGLRRRLKKDGQ